VRPCDPGQLDCDAPGHERRRELLLGGSVSQWGEKVDAFNFDADVWVGASALAERLWSDPPLGSNASATSLSARGRHHALSCHWKHWGFASWTRADDGSSGKSNTPYGHGSEYTAVMDASLGAGVCPADWSTVPE